MISKIKKIKITKKQIVIGSVILLLIGLVVLYDQAFNKPTALNSYISRTIYGAPANPSFVDDNLYECVIDAYNKENSTTLPYTTNLTNEQLGTISELVCSGLNKPEEEKITDISGIEKLINLTDLDLIYNNLTTIDLSANTALTELDLSVNNLTTIDLSANTALIYLDLGSNNLTTVDVSSNTALTELNLAATNLTTVDVSKNTALTNLSLVNNNITTLDVSSNTALTHLDLHGSSLTALDVSKNIALIRFSLSSSNLTTIDVSSNTALKHLFLDDNNLTTLDLSANTALTELDLQANNLTTLDLSANTALTKLDLKYNNLTTLDVSSNTALKHLFLDDNNLTTLDVSSNTALTYLYLGSNNLTTIDLSKNTALTSLDLASNNLTTIDVSSNTVLSYLYLGSNNLTEIDLNSHTALTTFELHNNQFNQNILIYKGDAIDFKVYNNVVILPSSLGNNYEGTTGVETTDGVASFNTSGQYSAISSYTQSVVFPLNISTYEITSNITVIEATSSIYDIDPVNNIINTGNETNTNTILNNISVNYGTKEIIDNKFVIKYEEEIIKEFELLNYSIDSSIIDNGKLIVKETTIEDFLQNPAIVINGYTYGVYNGANLLTAGAFGDNYTFRIMNGSTIVEEYELHYPVTSLNLQTGSLLLNTSDNTTGQIIASVTPSYASNKNITMSSSNEAVATVNSNGLVTAVSEGMAVITLITEDGNFTKTVNVNVTNIENLDEVVDKINKIPLGTDVGDLNLNLPASVTTIITDSKGNEKTSGKIGTGDTIEIIQSSGSTISVIYESVIVIKGDVTGDGISTVSDVAKLYQYYKEKITMDTPYVTAGSVVDTDNIIKIGDIAKLYQYIKGKISSL